MKDLDWSNLSFGYRQTDYNVRCYYRDGKWLAEHMPWYSYARGAYRNV